MSESDFWYKCQNCNSTNTSIHSFTEYGIKFFVLFCHDCNKQKVISKEYLEEDENDRD
jgi:hypothetical protein